jgi:signal transduction histidine kinase
MTEMGMGYRSAPRAWASALQALQRIWTARWRSRHLSIVLLMLVLFGESGVALFVMRDVAKSYATVERMYNGSVQGLQRFGDVQYEAQETRRSTLYALSTNDGNLQVMYADQSRNADRRVTQGITLYLAEARTAQELRLGKQLADDWNTYLNVRDEVLGLILEDSPKEAVHLDLNLGVPQFDRVRQDLDQIKQTYQEQASQQLMTVAELSRRSMAKLTAALVLGLLFGTVAIWAIQRSRMRNAVQLAKLQMDFVASVSHELRTPLTAIITAGENIRDGLASGRDRLFEQGSVITEQAMQLMELVDQVLQFSTASDGTLPHPLRELRVSEVVEDALRATESLVQDAGFSIEASIAADLPLITADLSLLSQCVQNLIVNALKYSGGRRWIGITARTNREESCVLISVADRGMGIQPSELSRIFEPFYRSPQVVAAKIHGTGLGLSISKRSAEVFGGELTVSSEVNVGSVFTLHLPIANPARQGAPVAQNAMTGIRA